MHRNAEDLGKQAWEVCNLCEGGKYGVLL